MSASSPGSKANKPSQKPHQTKAKPGAAADPESPRGIVPQPAFQPLPMKPRRGVFVALLSVFLVWVGVMLAMYVTTVRPRRHSAPPPASRPPVSTAPSLAGESPASSSPPSAASVPPASH